VTTAGVSLHIREAIDDDELSMLHAAAFGHPATHVEWRARLERHSLTWVTARDPGGRLTGFVNVVGDGGEHAFILDTVVSPADQRTGIGRSLVDAAEEAAREQGCRWLHVDYQPRDAAFYEVASGFRPTSAGLRDLSEPRPQPGDEDSQPAPDLRYLKYARVERERRWLLSTAPDLATATRTLEIRDRYLRGTRLRLREVSEADGTVVRKLGHKVRLGDGPGEVACTSIYLDDTEWDLLASLPADVLEKRRTVLPVAGGAVAVDVFGGHLVGLVLAEIDSPGGQSLDLPASFPSMGEVTDDEVFTGAALARSS
jgi:CYTH domain-containing protein/GNAT superfamily N-acetyltransferase